ncbi:hypothetical protein AVMA1855_15330 [Acidovorax sp. SUPP1855]|uniref:hypothetical protein n=1 Tax=Acidovorax sp. SUPP1855 TaxID=431774 RepID=UPI0023DE4FF3|nr:hypothetical protein [Acidovorax sp. SUPP1855]GKS85540.1 hypothetical protein AVMA1855_15330 [Acidovorax sp. SUPP1855]
MNDFEGVDAEGGESAKSEIVPGSKVETALAVLGKTSAGNLVKAVSSLCTALTDIPVAWLEGFAARERANTAGQVLISKTTAQRISNELEVPETYVEAAMHKGTSQNPSGPLLIENACSILCHDHSP